MKGRFSDPLQLDYHILPTRERISLGNEGQNTKETTRRRDLGKLWVTTNG